MTDTIELTRYESSVYRAACEIMAASPDGCFSTDEVVARIYGDEHLSVMVLRVVNALRKLDDFGLFRHRGDGAAEDHGTGDRAPARVVTDLDISF